MKKNLLHFLLLLLVMLTGTTLTAKADSYKVAPMTAGKVTVSPNDEFVNAPINITNYGTNPVKQITYTLYDFDTQGIKRAADHRLRDSVRQHAAGFNSD
mgnify:CR=1 FL=1